MKVSAKFLSALLAIVLVCSALPMAAFAAESDEHGAENYDYAPAAIGSCDHKLVYFSYEASIFEFDDVCHQVLEYEVRTCSSCNKRLSKVHVGTTYENHEFVLPEGQIAVGCIICGYRSN